MTPKAGGGRPWGPIRAENPAARKLAETLRRHVDESGKTLAVLGGEISMSKAQTGAYLAGKVPTQAFIVALIKATVRPELRVRRQDEALALREQAVRPAPRTAPDAPVVAGPGAEYAVELAAAQARQIETYDRLTRALEQRAEVERAKNNSDKLVMVLLNMIHQLDRRVASLVEERDQLLARPQSEALEDAERKLARAKEQEERARAELRRAEEKQRQAEDLEAVLQERLRRLTDELDRLRAGDTISRLDALPGLAEEDYGLGKRRPSADPVGDDIDAALARASAVNDEENTALNRLSSELDEPVAGVVPDNPPDNLVGPASRSVGVASVLPGVAEEGQETVRALLRGSPAPDLFVRFLSETTRWENVKVHGIKRQNAEPGDPLDYSRYLRLRRQGSRFGGFAYVYAQYSSVNLRLQYTREQLDALGATRARTRDTGHRAYRVSIDLTDETSLTQAIHLATLAYNATSPSGVEATGIARSAPAAGRAEEGGLPARVGTGSHEQESGVFTGAVARRQPAGNGTAPVDGTPTTSGDRVSDADPVVVSRPDGPWDISEQQASTQGSIHLGAFYVPKTHGIQLYAGLEGEEPAGLIAEIEDHRFEIRLLPESAGRSLWNSSAARKELEEYKAPVINWYSSQRSLPLPGIALATRHAVLTVTPGGEKCQVIVMGCVGPGWVFQLTWYRPGSSGNDERVVALLRTMLKETVINPEHRRKSGAFLLDIPAPSGPADRLRSKPLVTRQRPGLATPTPGRPSKNSAASTNNTGEPPAGKEKNPPRTPRPPIRPPAWVLLKDSVLTVLLTLWITTLAAGVTHRRWDGIGAARLSLTIGWALFLLLLSLLIYGAALRAGNTSARKVRTPSDMHTWIVLTGWLAACGGLITGLVNPRILLSLNTWGETLSTTLLF
ncbi:DUF3710 domain-containing protein [Streptomyces bacillaris]